MCIASRVTQYQQLSYIIDFTKAFNYVVRENLWLKLIKTGVRGKMLDVIISMYKCVKSVVKYDNCLSKEFSCFFWRVPFTIFILYILQRY